MTALLYLAAAAILPACAYLLNDLRRIERDRLRYDAMCCPKRAGVRVNRGVAR